MKFNFTTANRIIFGEGTISSLKEIVECYGKKVLIIKGKEKPDPAYFFSICKESNLEWVEFIVFNEPNIETINRAVEVGRKENCEFVIGFGGGSVIDTGKAVAALLNNEGSLLDYLEVVGKGNPLKNRSKPYIAIPTTAGTGSEVTTNAVIAVEEKKVKVSMRNAFLLPDVAIVDPELTYEVPKNITASTGMDALTQVLEPYVSRNHNQMVDLFCREGIPIGSSYLLRAWKDGSDSEARRKMAWVSLLGGLALANAKLGAVHGFAGPIGGMFHVPHGSVCAALLPSVFFVNVKALSNRGNNMEIISRYSDIAKWITGNEDANISEGVEWLKDLAKKINIPRLSELGIKKTDFPAIIEKSKNSSSMKGNPILLTDNELEEILELSY
ncbi:MAG: iron-containing alcohol dehydrogenase [Pelolinea sp.]|nr:iron-containing alcohol dehydrogenase [Pelolinea sp.]